MINFPPVNHECCHTRAPLSTIPLETLSLLPLNDADTYLNYIIITVITNSRIQTLENNLTKKQKRETLANLKTSGGQ